MTGPDNGLHIDPQGTPRCWWCGDDVQYIAYHDTEWGQPVGNDVRLFEKLSLEGFQAGLSWITILRKRENFRRAFAGFDLHAVASMTESDVQHLLADPGIIRHRGKIEATINNAQRAIELIDEVGSLASFVWKFEPSKRTSDEDCPSTSLESKALSKELKRRGWRFVGPTTAYSFMQAMGIVNDHLSGCAMHEVVEAARRQFTRP
ncbi:MAG: DNA-3-methyladenine glycosylase I [Pirellulaceae bacterium]|jgi:DNA-3-methyladenine glycosylase I|nr:DNA-3-methyladenine glycosylase I [Pirellulaceae bacterium]HJN08248.1 DNA-3-methyladenine glycosylase I [Pirellulaceae bacterium]